MTEVADVEYVMFETILAVAEEDPNEVHRALYNETFGPKVKMLRATKLAAQQRKRTPAKRAD